MKRLVMFLMTLCMTLGLLGTSVMSVRAAEEVLESEAIAVTRLEWLKALTEAFQMEVEESNYPDNYYSDVDASSEDYYDIMLATEFGLVDVETGDALRPDEAATREFVAHSLNVCMGYLPDEDAEYTFSEFEKVDYPDDIQIAIDKEWLTLSDGNFLPEQGITVAEKDKMIVVAEAAVASTVIDEDYDGNYQFVEGVIVMPETTSVLLTNEDELTFYNSSVELTEGDIFVVFSDGFPVARRAVAVVRPSANEMVVTVEGVEYEEAFTELDMQGTITADLSQVQAADDTVQLAYIVGGTEENAYEDGVTFYSLEEVDEQEITAVIATKTIQPMSKLRGAYDDVDPFKISCKITNVSADYGASIWDKEAFIKVSGKVTVSFNAKFIDTPISSDFIDSFVKVPIGVIGYFKPEVEGKVSGNASLALKGYLTVGVQWTGKEGIRLINDFKKESFTVQIKVEGTIGLKAAVGVDVGFLKAELYAKIGTKASANRITYTDYNYPQECIHVTAHLYSSVGGKITFKLIVIKTEVSLEKSFWTEKNSPVKIALHYEDGKAVSECTREKDSEDEEGGSSGSGTGGSIGSGTGTSGSTKKYKYYTPIDSQYAYSGINTGVSSKGEEITLFEYTLNEDNEATITKYNGNVAALNIPDSIDGYTVVGIGGKVFYNNKRIIMVNIPDTVAEIGGYAFGNCSNLADVTLSKSLISLGYSAFYNCDALTEIEIPKSLDTTTDYYGAEGAFRECDNLKKVTFEEGTTQVADRLFYKCTGLEEITIPDTVTIIETEAFAYCTNLKRINIPFNVTCISFGAFKGCQQLSQVEIPNSVTQIGGRAFSECSNLTDVTLSKSLTSLGYSAFYNCDALTEIEIPKSLDTTTDYYGAEGAFRECDNLKKVTFEEGTTQVADRLFYKCTGLEEIIISDTVTVIETEAFCGCTSLRTVELPNMLQTIEGNAFQNCSALQSIHIPDTVTGIGDYVFSGCSSLQSVKLPNIRKNIAEGTFRNCTSLTTIDLPESVTAIRQYAFQNTGLTEIVLPVNLTTIESYAFNNCDALQQVSVSDSVTNIGTYCFADCEVLSDVTLGSGLTKINSYTFNLCPALEKIVLPYRLNTVAANAFTNCTKLTELTIPRATTSIADNAFSYPTKMTVYGVAGTYAEEWAASVDATFVNQEKPATAVTLSETALTLQKGKTVGLTLTVTPPDFTDAIAWKSSNESVATISDTGVVTAKGVGTATIRVTVGNVSASCKVTVVQPVTSIYLNKSSLSLEDEAVYALTASVSPSNANDKTVTWSSSDETVATVDQTGVVTALKKGSAVITVTANDGSGISKTCLVTVTNNCFRCTDVTEMESTHNYENNCTDAWIYTLQGAERLSVTFDERTYVEDEFDYLYLYDAESNVIGQYTGATLAGETIVVEGDTIKVKLNADSGGNDWGFKITKIEEYCEHTFANTWSSDDTYHWHPATCGHTDMSLGKDVHTSGDWILDKAATTEEEGSRHKECTICARVLETEVLDKLYDPVRDLAERLDAAASQLEEATAELSEENYQNATAEEKQQAVTTVLEQVGNLCENQDITELGILDANTAITSAGRMTAVEQKISSLLNTSVTVIAKEEQEIALPIVQNALLSVPAGENATIQVAQVVMPEISDLDTTNAIALTMELYSAKEEKLVLKTPVVVTLPIPLGIDSEKDIVIYHFYDGNAEYTEVIPARIDRENNTITFVTGSFSTFAIVNANVGVEISGTVASFGSAEIPTQIQLLGENGTVVAETSVVGNSASYVLEDVAEGIYTLQVTKANHKSRNYSVVVGADTLQLDITIQLMGDVTGDGQVNARDKKLIYNHIAGTAVLTDYVFAVGDVTGDGVVNARDKKLVYNHIAGTASLWD